MVLFGPLDHLGPSRCRVVNPLVTPLHNQYNFSLQNSIIKLNMADKKKEFTLKEKIDV